MPTRGWNVAVAVMAVAVVDTFLHARRIWLLAVREPFIFNNWFVK
jgi:hypothetical protein